MIVHRCACEKSYIPIIMTSITWAGPRCVQELGTFLAPQNRIQGRCVMRSRYNDNIDIQIPYFTVKGKAATV